MTTTKELSFEQLHLIEPILRALKTEGYTTPTPIQEQAIPVVLKHHDLLGCAQTGTGKTAAFAIPILQLLAEEKHAPGHRTIKALVLTPTRELALQISESFGAYGRFTGLKHAVIFGGVSQHSQTTALRSGIDILVATPGRLLDLMSQRHVHLQHLKFFVLDEADRMLDMGFINDVKKIIAAIPVKRQTLFFSATMPDEIARLADTILKKPIRVEVTPVSSTAQTIQQSLYYVDKGNKKRLLADLLQDKSIVSALVFTRTKRGADVVARDLAKAGVNAEAIHGNKSQNNRQRALSNFKSGKTRVLVATDIAARGIDVDNLSHVINYEIPNISETYVHRIGRTGRAGASGIAISFCDNDEKPYIKDIQKLISRSIPVVDNHPYPILGNPSPDSAPKKQNRGQQRGRNKSSGGSRSGSSSAQQKPAQSSAAPKKKWKR
ncbi:MAG: DEAD/DEAH box helicase [Bacteroidetes bacterium]|nr:DEAD/DEAH box helicase [Bacteroidota bacterium]MBK9540795.1 DEAD/DEAH box helicase [Bacteroidota bacterium]MBP6403430.1 DEAD/DEAH box helicase [Bacteroidia bacterium]MBP6649870.1 DEAD/DEAH box helicase [Bacteroidia bacterium]